MRTGSSRSFMMVKGIAAEKKTTGITGALEPARSASFQLSLQRPLFRTFIETVMPPRESSPIRNKPLAGDPLSCA